MAFLRTVHRYTPCLLDQSDDQAAHNHSWRGLAGEGGGVSAEVEARWLDARLEAEGRLSDGRQVAEACLRLVRGVSGDGGREWGQRCLGGHLAEDAELLAA